MEQIKRLPDAELEIMKIIWEANEEVTSAYIMEQLKGVKTWGNTTVLNFLARLVERGFIQSERVGKSNVYTAIIDEKCYLQNESKSFLERLHGNSVKSLIAALYNGHTITEQDLKELKDFIDENTREG
ncbi:BlaI/MecI/CopY family transcriptional regulator [Cellulosilyticum sp. WCF-2]|uniref:BlaI/MecI/CopY family transcriptional regulator n=1 Tax=Cellulosilyticum sp. WCF-2 TaxID=2497860 RepID=UPI000F8DDBA4|nr:BlaI/MecI/CopY family transcriptional regulator [Cellulosilyticum sp. WCF-2]QEH66919.1 BlaI/MecI/CopY family transcriptional regulator [Cellulosilyticum sp. WCF-2]